FLLQLAAHGTALIQPLVASSVVEGVRENGGLWGPVTALAVIAKELAVSPLTVKTHVNRAMAKLGARDRAQLVVIAYESGLVRPRVR
ncbi:response regulator transcription factor, partial [Streptomyces sp. WAC 06725]|uniref:response regulator transcription factor n=1 Tax=Streptomyces sp. WAC 06725 TaxID=2203209 RepID=UPI0021ADBEFC